MLCHSCPQQTSTWWRSPLSPYRTQLCSPSWPTCAQWRPCCLHCWSPKSTRQTQTHLPGNTMIISIKWPLFYNQVWVGIAVTNHFLIESPSSNSRSGHVHPEVYWIFMGRSHRWKLWGKHFRDVAKFSWTTPHDALLILLPSGNCGQILISFPVVDVWFTSEQEHGGTWKFSSI